MTYKIALFLFFDCGGVDVKSTAERQLRESSR